MRNDSETQAEVRRGGKSKNVEPLRVFALRTFALGSLPVFRESGLGAGAALLAFKYK